MSRPSLLHRLGEAGATATSLRGDMPRWQRVLAATMVALVVGFLVGAVASQWSKLPDISWRFRPAWLVATMLALIVFQLCHAQLWVTMLRVLGAPMPRLRGYAVWSITLLARYVPTNLALLASRMALAEREGVPKRICAASIVYELGFTFAGAATVGAYFVITLPDLEGDSVRWLALAAPVVCLVALDPRVFHTLADWALRKLGRAALPTSLSRAHVLGFMVLFAGSFLIAGFAVYSFAQAVHGVEAGDASTAIGAYAVGFAASVLAFVLPGGLGAREGAMVAALSPILPVTVALAVAVGIRLAQMTVELLYAVVTPLLARRAGVPVE